MRLWNRWETLLSVLFVVMILWVVMISMMKIIEYDKQMSFDYSKTNYISVIEQNTTNLVKSVDTSMFNENEIFYLFKTWSIYKAYSWSTEYKYINYLWENVNSWSYDWVVYSRECLIYDNTYEWQLIKCWIKELIKK